MKVFLILSYLVILNLNCFAQKNNSNFSWIKFIWQDNKDFMMVPVNIEGCNFKTIMQFDMGADANIIYEKSLQSMLDNNDSIRYSVIDKNNHNISDGGIATLEMRDSLKISIGKTSLKNLYLYINYGKEKIKDSLHINKDYVIGTIGAPFFKDKILLIDYPNQRLCLLDSLPNRIINNTSIVNTKEMFGNRMIIPYKINNLIQWLLFDTGSSNTGISTDISNAAGLYSSDAKIDSSIGYSWGTKTTFYTAPLNTKCFLGETQLENLKVEWNNNQRLTDFNKKAGIFGITGNMPFFDKIIILDSKNKRFGIYKGTF